MPVATSIKHCSNIAKRSDRVCYLEYLSVIWLFATRSFKRNHTAWQRRYDTSFSRLSMHSLIRRMCHKLFLCQSIIFSVRKMEPIFHKLSVDTISRGDQKRTERMRVASDPWCFPCDAKNGWLEKSVHRSIHVGITVPYILCRPIYVYQAPTQALHVHKIACIPNASSFYRARCSSR